MPLDRLMPLKYAVYIFAMVSVGLAWITMIVLPMTNQVETSMKSVENRLESIEINQKRFYGELTVIKKRLIDLGDRSLKGEKRPEDVKR